MGKSASVLPRSFYLREDVVQIGRELLGKFLMTRINGVVTGGMIVEVEAYGGMMDKASHAHGNRRTNRTESMFLLGGHAYVYLCYGMYELFNVVTGKKDEAAAVLIRALEPKEGIETILRRRKMKKLGPRLSAGPGALTRALGITRRHDRIDLCGDVVWIEDRGVVVPKNKIVESPRVGVHYAEEDAHLHWRFRIKDSLWTSPAK